MEGVIILSNNKPLLSTRFAHPRLANLAVDAYLNAKRSNGNNRSGSGLPSGSTIAAYSSIASSGPYNNGKGKDTSLDPVIWFDAFEDFTRPSGGIDEATTNIGGHRRKGRPRQNSYSVSESDEDEESSEEELSDDEEDEDESGNAWASTSQTPFGDADTNGISLRTGTTFACCHITHNQLVFLVPMRQHCDPSVPFAYLYSLIGVLRQYIGGDVNDISIRENFDVTLQLLGETFMAPHPVSTDASALQELVPTSSLFSKMLSAGLAAATQATSSMGSNSGSHTPAGLATAPASLFSSPLYWRRAGIRHAQNEVYFDINEEVRAVLDKTGQIIAGDVWGRIDCRSRLSGMPDISISLSNPGVLDDPSFHPCVRIGKWTTNKMLSFVPPDGEFELMGYRLNTAGVGSLHRRSNTTSRASHTLPISIRSVITIGEIGGSFKISLGPSGTIGPGGVANLENVTLQFNLGHTAIGVKASIQSNDNTRLKALGSGGANPSTPKAPSGGSWEFDSIAKILTWRIPKLSSSPVLSGTWQFDDARGASRPSPVFGVSFHAAFTNISGLSITSLKLAGEKYAPYKGLRSNMKGSVEVRW